MKQMSDQANMTDGRKLELICEAFASAFKYAELERFVRYRFDLHLSQIAAGSTDLDDVCFKLADKSNSEGWLDSLVREAVSYRPNNEKLGQLPTKIGLHIDSNGSADDRYTTGRQQITEDTSHPILVIEDFKKDLEKIPADQSWAPEDFELELKRLQTWLAKVRAYSRALSPLQSDGSNLEQRVLSELRLLDAIERMLAIIDDFEICLNCLLDPRLPFSTADQTEHIQWFREASLRISEGLDNLGLLGRLDPERFRKPKASFECADFSLPRFGQDLNNFKVTDNRAMEEWQKMLIGESGAGACFNGIMAYLRDASLPSANSISVIHEFLADFRDFIERMAAAQRRLPSTREDSPVFSQRDSTRMQKGCDKTLDSLDLYKMNLELLSRWKEAAIRGTFTRIDFRDLYEARRAFIDNLTTLRYLITAFVR